MHNRGNKIPQELDYGAAVTMKILRGKYKPCIISCIAKGINRPVLICREMQSVNRRVVIHQLRELYEYKIVSKKIFQGPPAQAVYGLTPLGQSLLPVIKAMEEWGNRNAAEIYAIAVKRKENVLPL